MIAKNAQIFAHHVNSNARIYFRTLRNSGYDKVVSILFGVSFRLPFCFIVLLIYFVVVVLVVVVDSKHAQIDHLLFKVCDRGGSRLLHQVSGYSQNSSFYLGVIV